jgi:hypothetical protein
MKKLLSKNELYVVPWGSPTVPMRAPNSMRDAYVCVPHVRALEGMHRGVRGDPDGTRACP